MMLYNYCLIILKLVNLLQINLGVVYQKINGKKDMLIYSKLFNKLEDQKKIILKNQIYNLRFYGFCKAHSFSYAQLVYKLAYYKAHYPKEFLGIYTQKCM